MCVYHSFSDTYLDIYVCIYYIYIHKSIKYNMISLISVRISHSYPGPALSSLRLSPQDRCMASQDTLNESFPFHTAPWRGKLPRAGAGEGFTA